MSSTVIILIGILLAVAIGAVVWIMAKGKGSSPVRASRSAPAPEAAEMTEEEKAAADARAELSWQLDQILNPGVAEGGYSRDAMDGPPMKPQDLSPDLAKAVDEAISSMDQFAESFQRFKVFNNPNASLKDISDAVTGDLIFSTKVLKSANSPFFGMKGKVASVHHAVTILGMDSMKTLYFREYFKMLGGDGTRQAELRNRIWSHSMATAIIASSLSQCAPGVKREVAFTLGLLHDLGKFIVQGLPSSNGDEASARGGIRAEMERVGVHHALAGRIAAERWELPAVTARAIGLHHSLSLVSLENMGRKRGFFAHLAVLYLADQLAKLLVPDAKDPATPHPLPKGWTQFLDMNRVRSLVLDGELERELAKGKAANA